MTIKIKSGKLVASVLLLLVGFCAGVGMNLLPVSRVVHGAPGDPNPALKRVEHDATLTGDGTASAPLVVADGGIGTAQLANGAVTAPKLSAAAPPSLGQILGFNGANLAWQNAPVGGVRVVDSVGNLVGPYVIGPNSGDTNFTLHYLSGHPALITTTADGFPPNGPSSRLFYTSVDCSGDRYVEEEGTNLLRKNRTIGSRIVYAADPIQQLTIRSYAVVLPNYDWTGPVSCFPITPSTSIPVGVAIWLDIPTLGLVPPFHLEF